MVPGAYSTTPRLPASVPTPSPTKGHPKRHSVWRFRKAVAGCVMDKENGSNSISSRPCSRRRVIGGASDAKIPFQRCVKGNVNVLHLPRIA